MKTVFSKKPPQDTALLALKEDLLVAQRQLEEAYACFDAAVEPELVESCIYQISAAKARYNYLIRAVKEHTALTAAAASTSPEDSVCI